MNATTTPTLLTFLAAAGLTGGLAAGQAGAAPITVVNDTFEIGATPTTSPGTRGDDAGDPSDVAFFNSGFSGISGSSFQVVNDTVLASNALRSNPNTATFTKFVGFFAPVTLANVGDAVSLSFRYRVEAAPNAGNGLRFGLYNSAGTRQTADGSSSLAAITRNDDAGYLIATNLGAVSSSGTITAEEAAGDDILGGSGAAGITGFGSGLASFVHSTTTAYDTTLTLTRTAGGLAFTGNLGSVVFTARTDATPVTLTFDEIAIGAGNAAFPIAVDNVNVTFTPIPEPTAVAAGVAGLGGLLMRRRARA